MKFFWKKRESKEELIKLRSKAKCEQYVYGLSVGKALVDHCNTYSDNKQLKLFVVGGAGEKLRKRKLSSFEAGYLHAIDIAFITREAKSNFLGLRLDLMYEGTQHEYDRVIQYHKLPQAPWDVFEGRSTVNTK